MAFGASGASGVPGDTARDWLVVCLCAGWCGVCRTYGGPFAEAAQAHPGVHFGWVDVEDEADLVGELDIETFPTVLVARAGVALYLAPLAPSAASLSRLVQSLRADPARAGLPDPAAQALAATLDTHLRTPPPLANP